MRFSFAGIVLIFTVASSPVLLSCAAESDYSRITQIEFSRGWVTKDLTKSDGVTVEGGCWMTAESTPNDAKLTEVLCRRKADGSFTAGGGYAGFAPTEPPAEIFKSLVAILCKAHALDLGVPPRRPKGYANDVDTYVITIRSANTTNAFWVDASASHRLSPEESAAIDLFAELLTTMGNRMRAKIVL